MLILFTRELPSEEQREKIRMEIKDRTGEECLILGPAYSRVLQLSVKKERAVPLHKRLPQLFTWRNRRSQVSG